MESVEIVAGVISRYAIMEELYCQRCITDAEKGVRKTIIAMYTAVLAFLCKASEYFGKRSIGNNILRYFDHRSLVQT